MGEDSRVECDGCRYVTQRSFSGKKDAKKVAGVLFEDDRTWGTALCPMCQYNTDNRRGHQLGDATSALSIHWSPPGSPPDPQQQRAPQPPPPSIAASSAARAAASATPHLLAVTETVPPKDHTAQTALDHDGSPDCWPDLVSLVHELREQRAEDQQRISTLEHKISEIESMLRRLDALGLREC